jgi:hypothetical protein
LQTTTCEFFTARLKKIRLQTRASGLRGPPEVPYRQIIAGALFSFLLCPQSPSVSTPRCSPPDFWLWAVIIHPHSLTARCLETHWFLSLCAKRALSV